MVLLYKRLDAYKWEPTGHYDKEVLNNPHICFRWRTTHQPYASKTLNAFSPTSEPSLKIDPWHLISCCSAFFKMVHVAWKLWKLRHRQRLFTIVLYYSICYYLFCTIVLIKYWTYTCNWPPPSSSLYVISSSESPKCSKYSNNLLWPHFLRQIKVNTCSFVLMPRNSNC